MLAIYKRELKSYLTSFIGMLFIAVTLFFIGLYFTVYNLMNGYPYFSYTMSSIVFLLLIAIPVLSMRVLAEERRSKTDQLILTAPVSIWGVVGGKYLALLTIWLIPVGISCLYPLLMSSFGTIPLGEAYLSVLAIFLYGAACQAVCMLVSSVTESQVIAAVLSFAALFLGYMMSSICGILSSSGNLLTKILGCYDLYTPFANLLEGTLNIASVVYFLSLILLMLFLTVQSIQKRRYSVSVKNLSFGAYSTGMIAVMIAIVVVLNLIMGEMPSTWTEIDLTAEKIYSLTDQTLEYLDTIDEDVTIYVLANESSADTTVAQTLRRYEDLCDHITVEYVDPSVNPLFYQQYTTDSVTSGSLIVVSSERSKVIDYNDLYEIEYSMDYTTYSYTSEVTGYDAEGQITSALDYVLSDDIPKVYLTSGHGEYELSTSFGTALEKENVEYETISLMDYDTVPEDTACLVIDAPTSDFSADDAQKVTDYLDQGGKVVVVVGYTEDDTPNFDTILDYMGLSVVDGLIIETNESYYYRVPYYLLPAMSSTTYTSGLEQYYIFAPYSQGIAIADEEAEDMTYTSFLTTSDSAFSKVSTETMDSYDKAEGDVDGPFNIAVEAIKTLDDETEATMVVYGCEALFTDDADSMVSGANSTLFTNTVSSFVDHEVSVSIAVKSYEVSYLTVTQSAVILWGLLTTVILPLGCLIVGFVVWFSRRKK